MIDIELTNEEYAFGVDKTQPELLEAVNEFIREIQGNGVFDEICSHYFGDGTPPYSPALQVRTIPARIRISAKICNTLCITVGGYGSMGRGRRNAGAGGDIFGDYEGNQADQQYPYGSV